MIRALHLMGALALAGCGGGGSSTSTPPPVTIPDLSAYLAQARCPDGGRPTTCANPAPQKASDLMSWRRFDGQDQYSDGVVSDDGTFWVTTWSYPPHGVFVAANGDGGEVYKSDGTTVSIVATQDGGKPGVQRFPEWGLFSKTTPDCSVKWGAVDTLGRACKATVTYPGGIVADTIISEHYVGANQQGAMERFYMGYRWSRLAWESYRPSGQMRIGAPAVGPSGVPAAPSNLVLIDRRLTTNLTEVAPLLSVDGYGWPPPGVP